MRVALGSVVLAVVAAAGCGIGPGDPDIPGGARASP